MVLPHLFNLYWHFLHCKSPKITKITKNHQQHPPTNQHVPPIWFLVTICINYMSKRKVLNSISPCNWEILTFPLNKSVLLLLHLILLGGWCDRAGKIVVNVTDRPNKCGLTSPRFVNIVFLSLSLFTILGCCGIVAKLDCILHCYLTSCM